MFICETKGDELCKALGDTPHLTKAPWMSMIYLSVPYYAKPLRDLFKEHRVQLELVKEQRASLGCGLCVRPITDP